MTRLRNTPVLTKEQVGDLLKAMDKLSMAELFAFGMIALEKYVESAIPRDEKTITMTKMAEVFISNVKTVRDIG